MRAKRHAEGSVLFDKRTGKWRYQWWDGPEHRSKTIGNKQQYPNKASAWAAVKAMTIPAPTPRNGETVAEIAASYKLHRMSEHHETARVNSSFLDNHVLPKWGSTLIRNIAPQPVELWLKGLTKLDGGPLSPKSKTHIRSTMSALVEYAMFSGVIPIGTNPIALVKNKGATKKVRKARSLTEEEFRSILEKTKEPFRTLSLVTLCLGLRISETFGLRWSDVDWLDSTIMIQRSVVRGIVGCTKTEGSEKELELAPDVRDLLQSWRKESHFRDPEDFIFASPYSFGLKPWSYTATLTALKQAAKDADMGHISTHVLRHTFRSWLDAAGAKPTVQQKMMRHADIRTTMNIYGDVVTREEREAAEAVSKMAFQ